MTAATNKSLASSSTTEEPPPEADHGHRPKKILLRDRDDDNSKNSSTSGGRIMDASQSSRNTSDLSKGYYSEGREFYDEYDNNDSEVSSIPNLLLGDNHQQLLDRNDELKHLKHIYQCVVLDNDDDDDDDNDNDNDEDDDENNINNNESNNATNHNNPHPRRRRGAVAMLSGLSGTGKSTLVQSFLRELKEDLNMPEPFFLHGKYDELSGGAAEPFSAIVEAFSGFASELLLPNQTFTPQEQQQQQEQQAKPKETQELKRVRQLIQQELGSDGADALRAVIPALRPVLGKQEERTATTTDDSLHMELAWNRLKFFFQKFCNAISTKERPVLMFLDDLQWCDPASLELMQALLTDHGLKHFMFVGAYRSDEVQESSHHPLQETLRSIEQFQSIQYIELVHLTLEQTSAFLTQILKVELDHYGQDDASQKQNSTTTNPNQNVENLAQVIHGKTKGNLFYTVQVLEELQRKGVLEFSRLTFQWEWHLENVDQKLSTDVLDSVISKIQASDPLIQKALIVAAYTRSTFDCDTLWTLLLMDDVPLQHGELITLLDQAVLDGLLTNTMGSRNYSFGHDRIQQAAHTLVPEGTARNDFRKKNGERLYALGSKSGGEDWMLFSAADHINATFQPGQDDFMTSIKLNLEVGERAASISAHTTSSKFLGVAMQHLLLLDNGNPWGNEDHYDITLKVYRLIAEGELNQGKFDIGSGIAKTIMENAKCLDDKLPTQLALAKALGRENLHRESLRVTKSTLRAMHQYPKGKAALLSNLTRDFVIVKRYFRTKSNDDIVGLPLMQDKRTEMTMEFLSSAAYNSFFLGHMVQYLSIVLHMLRTTFKYGLCGQSGVALTGYSLFSSTINDMKNAVRFFNVARKVLDKTKAKHLEGLQLFVFAHWVAAWKDPDDLVLAIYERANQSAMESGDFENGMLSATASYHQRYVSGHALEGVDIKFTALMEQLTTYKCLNIQFMTVEQWLVVRHLRGTATSQFDYEELRKFGPTEVGEGDDERYRLLYGYIGRLQLGVYFGNYEFAEEILERLKAVPNFDKAHGTNSLRLFFAALTYSHLCKITGKKWYYRKAKKFCQELRTLCKSKGLRSWHRVLILEAHLRSSGGKSASKAQSSYDSAIAEAIRTSHIQDAGLACQLAGENFLSMSDGLMHSKVLLKARDNLVRKYFGKARDHYKKWGATALIRHLEQTHANYFDSFLHKKMENKGLRKSSNSDNQSFNSLLIGWDSEDDSIRELPKILEAPPKFSADDISVISDTSAWKNTSTFVNPHTDGGDFPETEDCSKH